MTWTPPVRAPWVEKLNTVGSSLGGARQLVPLDQEELLAAAQATTGLEEWGGLGFREGLRVLVEALEREARLNVVGRLLARSEIVRCLENRLRITDWRARHPDIGRGEIRRPVFVVGSPRTGTSILHELLACDPDARAPAMWEMLYSCPPPETATYDVDPRIEAADREVTLWADVVPEYQTMHENSGRLPNECIFIFTHEFASDHFGGCHDAPSYASWLAASDARVRYELHRKVLQLLQWRHPGDRWVLKAPSHTATLPALFAVYPDAEVIQLHRDPLAVLPSVLSLMATLRWMRSDEVDYAGLVRLMPWATGATLEGVIQQRAAGTIPSDQVHDVLYADLVADPMGTIAGLYERLGLELSATTRGRMQDHLASKPQGRHGRHRYSFADTGLDREEERARFAAYQEHYGVPDEG